MASGGSFAARRCPPRSEIRGWEVAAGGVAGLAAGFLIWGLGGDAPETPAPTPAASQTASSLETQTVVVLRERLAEETRLRLELERELDARAPQTNDASPEPSAEGEPGGPSERPADGWIQEPLLARAGFTPAEIEALRERFDAIELKRLFLRDRATREDWIGKPRYRKRIRALNAEYDALRDEHGDDRYDWILFAAGRHNRVVVERVMGDSAAAEVGIEVGDVFLAYDGERVFDSASLQRATTAGEFGETVSIDVLRDGERIRVHPPRGPLGIGMRVDRLEPRPLY